MHALLQGDFFFQAGGASDPEVEAIVRACMERDPEIGKIALDFERRLDVFPYTGGQLY